MSALRAVLATALADFQERTRRQGFLGALALVGWLAYLVASGGIALRLEGYQGVMNAAWLGSLLALIVSTVLGWLGFFLVNHAIHLDRSTGVGEVLAASALSRWQYSLAKWLSNVAVLGVLVGLLLLASLILQGVSLSQSSFDLAGLLVPILVIALPLITVTAACGVLFESTRWLRGTGGHVLWLLGFWPLAMASHALAGGRLAALDLTGLNLLVPGMQAAVKEGFPGYQGGFALTFVPRGEPKFFLWTGIDWSVSIVLLRLLWVAVAVLLALLAAVWLARYDPVAVTPDRRVADAAPAGDRVSVPEGRRAQARELPASVSGFAPGYRVQAELRGLFAGTGRLWWAVAAALLVAGLAAPPEARGMLLLASWVWPVTIWSRMGSREATSGTQETVFSSPHPLGLQLPTQWLAGCLLALLAGGGVLARLLIAGGPAALLAPAVAVLLIPSLALALGVITGTSKAFEVVYLLLCYIGPLNGPQVLDFMGARGPGAPQVWLAVAAVSLCAAFLWRAWRLRR